MAEQLSILVEQVRSSLARVVADPQEQLDGRLLEKCRDQLIVYSDSDLRSVIPTLLPELLSLLPSLIQDPKPVVDLISKLLQPLSFAETLSYTSGPSTLVEALRSPSKPVNLLAVEVLMKAANSTGDVAMIAGMKDVVSDLISAYLLRDTEVSFAIADLLEQFMYTDFSGGGYEAEADIPMSGMNEEQTTRPRGQGLMWRRLFEDKDIYTEFFSLTSLKNGEISKKERTIAQARLLAILPHLAKLDFDTIKRSHFPEVESQYGLEAGEEGLLDYAACHMVDFKDDVLMHMTLLEFYTSLLRTVTPSKTPLSSSSPLLPTKNQHSSLALDFFISRGIHARAMTYYLYPGSVNDPTKPWFANVDPLDVSFLAPRSANYIATYASTFPKHILAAESVAHDKYLLIDHIETRILDGLRASSRQTREGPTQDLHILASLPRIALLPRIARGQTIGAWRSSPVSQLHARHQDDLKTLGVIFKNDDHSHSEPTSDQTEIEAAAARALFFLYLDDNPDLFTQLVNTASTIALKEPALAAIGVISALITAKWARLPTTPPPSQEMASSNSFSLPTESQLQSWLRQPTPVNLPLPATGLEVICSDLGKAVLIPYLCSPPRTFSHLVGGRGDAESAAYQVAMAKYDALRKLYDALKRVDQGQYDDVRAFVTTAVNRGPWGGTGDVGGSVGTLEF